MNASDAQYWWTVFALWFSMVIVTPTTWGHTITHGTIITIYKYHISTMFSHLCQQTNGTTHSVLGCVPKGGYPKIRIANLKGFIYHRTWEALDQGNSKFIGAPCFNNQREHGIGEQLCGCRSHPSTNLRTIKFWVQNGRSCFIRPRFIKNYSIPSIICWSSSAWKRLLSIVINIFWLSRE